MIVNDESVYSEVFESDSDEVNLSYHLITNDLGDCSWFFIFTDRNGDIVNIVISPVHSNTADGCFSGFREAMAKAVVLAENHGWDLSGESLWIPY